jgi:hypothetical protein
MMGTLQIQREARGRGRVCLVLMGINIGIKDYGIACLLRLLA